MVRLKWNHWSAKLIRIRENGVIFSGLKRFQPHFKPILRKIGWHFSRYAGDY